VPTAAETAGSPEVSRVRLAESGVVLDAKHGETVIETLERYGYRPDFECRAGACGTCRLRLLAGEVHNGVTEALTPSERRAGYILACVAQPVGKITLAGVEQPVAQSGHSPGIGARPSATSRRSTRKALRWAMAAAVLGLFFSLWDFTSHSLRSQTTSSNGSSTSLPSLPSLFPKRGDDGGDSGQGQSPSNPGSFSTQPSQNVPSTSTGVS
jgi:ferredoxin